MHSVDRYMRLLRVVCCVLYAVTMLQVEKLMKKMQTMPEYASVGQAVPTTTQHPTAPYSTLQYPTVPESIRCFGRESRGGYGCGLSARSFAFWAAGWGQYDWPSERTAGGMVRLHKIQQTT